MSSPLPWGTPSRMSSTTTSASSLSAILRAAVAPTFPEPITLTFLFTGLSSSLGQPPSVWSASVPSVRRGASHSCRDARVVRPVRMRRPFRSRPRDLHYKIFNRKCGKPCGKMSRQELVNRIKRDILAICTIVVRQGHRQRFPANGETLYCTAARTRRRRPDATGRPNHRATPSMKIVISDALPTTAADLLRDVGWTVDAQPVAPATSSKRLSQTLTASSCAARRRSMPT